MSTVNPSIKVGNLRTLLRCTITEVSGGSRVAVDLSTSSKVEIELEKPDGSRLDTITASIQNPPGSDGIINHTDTTGIFDQKGRWKIRCIVTFSDGSYFKGSWHGFIVSD